MSIYKQLRAEQLFFLGRFPISHFVFDPREA
jgi:hypothetical protein